MEILDNKIIIRKTKTTPEITIDYDAGTCHIEGESCPENATEFYHPVNAFVGQSILKSNRAKLYFNLDYYNTTSSKAFIKLFDAMESFYADGAECLVIWVVPSHDPDMIEAGEDLLHGLLIPYEIIS